jgi:hypothetical protein
MKISKLASMVSPPPPPPPLPSKSSRKTLIAALIIVIIVIAAIVGAYALTRPGTNNPSPSPTASPSSSSSSTATPSGTSSPSSSGTPTTAPTASPTQSASPGSSANPIANFKAGTWANYTMKSYDAGTLAYESHIKESVGEETYKGISCWLITMATDQTVEGTATTSVTKIWMSKGTLQGIHMRMEVNGVVLYDEDLNDTSTIDPGTTGEIDPSTIVSYETVTVTAGTFTNCAKASTTTTTTAGTSVSYVWANQKVPVFGLVKMESYLNQQLSSSMELTAYSG